jgi:hypothetical protein
MPTKTKKPTRQTPDVAYCAYLGAFTIARTGGTPDTLTSDTKILLATAFGAFDATDAEPKLRGASQIRRMIDAALR